MKVATGPMFFEHFAAAAREIVPDIDWAIIDADGGWSQPPEDCDLIVYAADAYTKAFIDTAIALPAARWAHSEDAGTDGRFYDGMRANGVMVTHSPGANAPEVAEFAIGLLLWSAKRLDPLRDAQRDHRWDKQKLESLSDKTLLVVGLGNIGGRVAALGKAFGMRVLGTRRSPEPVANVDRQGTLADLGDFLAEADYIVLALPATAESTNLIDTDALARMKPGATLVNVARGAVVDLEALRRALATGTIRQACLDVLPSEPWPAEDTLWDLPNLFITPHNAADSPLYLRRVGELWLENLRRYVRGEPLLHRAF